MKLFLCTNKGKMLTAISLLLLLAVALPLFSGCDTVVTKAEELSAGYTRGNIQGKAPDEDFGMAQTAFSLALLRATMEGSPRESILLSPLSVTLALAMAANGAASNTLAEMERVLGGEVPLESLNEYFYGYLADMPAKQVKIANSLWLRQEEVFHTVSSRFLQTNADYYGAQVYRTPFDKTLPKKVNGWVLEHTDGMIEELLRKVPDENVFIYLINALSFEGRWRSVYEKKNVQNGVFHAANGQTQAVKMMYSEESRYFESEDAAGFVKPYEDGRFAFAAILPKAELSLQEFVGSLTAARLSDMLSRYTGDRAIAAIPKFTAGSDLSLVDALQKMGIRDAFTVSADFTAMADDSEKGDIWISEVLHKTYIEVAEKGTKAGAATSVEMNDKGSADTPAKEVILDRPFVYMIIDTQTNSPIFIGTLASIDG